MPGIDGRMSSVKTGMLKWWNRFTEYALRPANAPRMPGSAAAMATAGLMSAACMIGLGWNQFILPAAYCGAYAVMPPLDDGTGRALKELLWYGPLIAGLVTLARAVSPMPLLGGLVLAVLVGL